MMSRTTSKDAVATPTSTPNQPLCNPFLLPEIWLVVFPYLTSSDLQSISLTCSNFRYMAQPLLFSVLDVSPFLLSYNAEGPIRRPLKYLPQFLERLEYYKLPHISHGVRHCWISPYSRSGFPARNQRDNLDPILIINAAVEVLPHFTNLSTLSWHCIDMAPRWWTVIQSLRITKLWLNSSSIFATDIPSLRTIHHLDLDQWPWQARITNQVSIHEERSPGVSAFALQHIIQPEVIRSISVPRTDTACHIFSILSETTYNLVSLKIPFSSVSHPDFISALEHSPKLVYLCFFPPSSDEKLQDIKLGAFAPSILPSLTHYEGPYTQVFQFCHRPLKCVSLWGFDDKPALCDSEALTNTLNELAETLTVESLKYLSMMVIGITHDLLEVLSLFIHLECITIKSQEESSKDLPLPHHEANAPVTSLYVMMDKITLPPRIKHVKFTTRYTSHKMDLSAQEYEAASFMESFAHRHPTMQRMEIEYGIYWTGMYTVVWGRVRENGAYGGNTSLSADEPTVSIGSPEGDFSSESSSKDHILSTVVSAVRPLPLGELKFTEHRRRILFPQNTSPFSPEDQVLAGKKFWLSFWARFRRLFGKT